MQRLLTTTQGKNCVGSLYTKNDENELDAFKQQFLPEEFSVQYGQSCAAWDNEKCKDCWGACEED